MSDDFVPETQPSGALDPPRRRPPTAVGTLAVPPHPFRVPQRRFMRRSRVQQLLGLVFDGLDRLGDRIARASGVRG